MCQVLKEKSFGEFYITLERDEILEMSFITIIRERVNKIHKLGLLIKDVNLIFSLDATIRELINRYGDGRTCLSFEKLFHVNETLKVKVHTFAGGLHVDIRNYFHQDGQLLPTTVGVTIPALLYEQFREIAMEMIEEAPSL
ncbi:hypothetical protein ACF0H5_019941 [Mactra antiquata]